jgi:hypothetical protein
LFPNSYIIPFWQFCFLPFSVHAQTNVIYVNVYNILNPKETSASITSSLSDNYGVLSPKYDEACTVISKQKSNKAGSADNIPLELIIKKKRVEEEL